MSQPLSYPSITSPIVQMTLAGGLPYDPGATAEDPKGFQISVFLMLALATLICALALFRVER